MERSAFASSSAWMPSAMTVAPMPRPMATIARALTVEEASAAAAYYASLPRLPWITVIEADMVIACFGGNYNGRAGWAVVTEHIQKYILGAVKQ